MSYTYEELKDKLVILDEITLMELLEITSEDLVAKFQDRIERNYDDIYFKVTGECL
jgi:hypothetical protein